MKNIRIICINNSVRYDNLDIFAELTIGKEYIMSDINDRGDTIWIVNNLGYECGYDINRFLSLNQYRDNVISDILE